MQPIPQPELLDPDRMLSTDRDDMTADEHRSRANELASALEDSCHYAQQLWQQLQQVREYLVRALPDDPQRPEARRTVTAPAGPEDEAGWHDWIGTYAAVTSVLCGPNGDSGFSADEAREHARARRAAPVPVLPDHALTAAGAAASAPRKPWWQFWRR